MTAESKIKVWMEGGILYNEYYNGVNLEIALKALKEGVSLIEKSGKEKVPAIAIFKNVSFSSMSVRPMDLATLFRSADIEKHFGDIWLVGAPESTHLLIKAMTRPFFGDKFHIVDNKKTAKLEIKEKYFS